MITTTQTVRWSSSIYSGAHDVVEFANPLPEIPSMDLGSCFYVSKEDSDKVKTSDRWKELVEKYGLIAPPNLPSWLTAPTMAMENARAMQQVETLSQKEWAERVKERLVTGKEVDRLNDSLPIPSWLTSEFVSNEREKMEKEAETLNSQQSYPKPDKISPGQVYRDLNGSIVSSQSTDLFVVLRLSVSVIKGEDTWEIAQFPTYTNHGLGGAQNPERLFSKSDIQKLQYIGSISDVEHPHYKIPPDLSKGLSRLQHLVPKEIPAGASITDWAADEIVRLRENLSQLEATRLFGK